MRTKVAAMLGFAVGCVSLGLGAGVPHFRDVPPLIGAYTLRGGQVQLGAGLGFQVAVPPSNLAGSITAAVGITSWFQVGIGVTSGVQPGLYPTYMTYSGQAKLRLALGGAVDLGIPFGVSFVDRGMGTEFGYVQGGAVASVRLGVATAHGGVDVGFVKGGGWYLHPYAIVDYDVLPTVKLVAELGLVPLSVGVGAWLRLLDFLDLKLALAPLALSVTGGVYLRF